MINPMWILLLEAGVALSLLILIVWWTRPRKKNREIAQNKEGEKNNDNVRSEE